MDCTPILSIKNISKEFPGVRALNDVSIDIFPGKVHVLIGENGAGKSTLIKMLSGVYSVQQGSVIYKGEQIKFKNPKQALESGISVIHQELSVVPDLTVADNMFLGRESTKGTLIDRRKTNEIARRYLEQLKITVSPNARVSTLSNADKQMVEIARAISLDASVVIMDEPTSSISDAEVQTLFNVIRALKEKNVAIIYISHRLKELFEIGDRLSVLRDGCLVKTDNVSNVSMDQLISYMVGREITNFFHRTKHSVGKPVLEVSGLSRKGEFHNISFEVGKGEIVGIAGLIGAGRTELLRAIFGASRPAEGKIVYKGKQVYFRRPSDAIEAKIGFVPEERRTEGIIIDDDVKTNISLPNIKVKSKRGVVDRKWEREVATEYVKKLHIKTPSIDAITKNLSGGNQQKVVIAKWWVSRCDLLLLDELTRGIDVSAKAEIYALIGQYVKSGGSVLMVSSELPELLGVCDRIMVMREGRLIGNLDRSEASEQKIMRLASIQQ